MSGYKRTRPCRPPRRELSTCPRAAMANYHTLVAENDRDLFSHSSGGQKFKTKVSHGWFLLESLRESVLCLSPIADGGRQSLESFDL